MNSLAYDFFLIHPEPCRIRVFVPCEIIIPLHDKEALLYRCTSGKALQNHYAMGCIENIAARGCLFIKPRIPRAARMRGGIAIGTPNPSVTSGSVKVERFPNLRNK
ncbi:hypothetical protein F4680DRAFT_7156 [Xylaria scruposa]|nr:hypothetical protein F4680DRAFT_7156 [Xylaria scruposa]